MNIEVEAAFARHKATAERLVETISRIYPVGSVVQVETNTVAGNRVHSLRVVCHSGWWCDPMRMVGTNVETGKQRTFDVRSVVGKVSAAAEQTGSEEA